MTTGVAIVGMACRYPDARSPRELWENVLAQRRAFRRLPAARLNLDDYHSADRAAEDRTYSTQAAVIEGYEFDRVRFRVVGSTFRSADLAHWLALDVASQALADAGFAEGEGLPRESTGVLLGNTLTGEFSRANVMRLRWPYVRRVVDAALAKEDWSPQERGEFLARLEAEYKAPFPAVGEETLAGGLSNTIAGRICNHFDLKGGGYTVDGACAASLLAITHACASLVAGDLDVALAGGVDLSLDPFELVGFAKIGALAPQEMRVYDVRSAGFWPGEGCGMVALMRHVDALAQRRRIYAVIRGWGVSSDGSGGITRPEVEGQLLAVRRAYARAGFGIESVAYFEGHGTGTEVGDATELRMLSRARRESSPTAAPAAIGSIKANIGHTKAAAGAAGLIKATMALHAQLLPPTTGCAEPHAELSGAGAALRVLPRGEPWPAEAELRAGVSAMGFGGINTHVVLEAATGERRRRIAPRERGLLFAAQDAELFLLDAHDTDDLRRQVEHLLTFAALLARAELIDLAAQLQTQIDGRAWRAACVASSAEELTQRLEQLRAWLSGDVNPRLDVQGGVFLGRADARPRIGFLFPGQGSPAHVNGGALRRRFEFVDALYARANLPAGGDSTSTAVAQPAIVTASLAGLGALDALGVEADVGIGHSLGEFTAMHWGGAFDADALLRIAAARGRAMAELGAPTGAMASIAGGREQVAALLDGEPVVIAGLNSPRQTVVSGEARGVASVAARARGQGLRAATLPVSHAFHSPLVAAATPVLAERLAGEQFEPLKRRVISTISGGELAAGDDLRELLCRQVTSPVRFAEALGAALDRVDLWIEVGPGQVLSGLLSDSAQTPIVPLDAGGPSLSGLLKAIGAAFALGAAVEHGALFAGRLTRPFSLDWQPKFFVNPCELAPRSETPDFRPSRTLRELADVAVGPGDAARTASKPSAIDVVRQLVAKRAELPVAAVRDDHFLLRDLHLNSISVGQLVAEAARSLGATPPTALTDFAGATVSQLADALDELVRGITAPAAQAEEERVPAGVDTWVRAFTVEWIERALPQRVAASQSEIGPWRVIAPPDYPACAALEATLAHAVKGGGVVVCLPPAPDERSVPILLDSARAALANARGSAYVLVQHGGGGAAFARTLHLEANQLETCVVDVPPGDARAIEWIVAEASAAQGYSEARYDSSGRRYVPVLRAMPWPSEADAAHVPLGRDDVLLVTGGGKGIAAECALSLARETGVRLVLLGRSQPAKDAELAANLDRMSAEGTEFRYLAADVTDAEAVRGAVRDAESQLGPVTAILHGAGANVPQLISGLDEPAFQRTLAPKVAGARNVLAAVDPARLRLFISFGSIIARTGMRGEADYAVANDWLAATTEQWQAEHPHCRCLALEWSVWSGVGMGERLGRVEALRRQGITPITPDEGIEQLRRLLRQPPPAVRVVVAGRFGDPPTLAVERPELPLRRFLERPRAYYPGIELVADSLLSAETDPYLKDHVFRGERLLPAVMGLEAMAQAAMALMNADAPPVFEKVEFARPVVIPDGRATTIRVAALARGPRQVDVVLRCEHTGFAADHFRATCRWGVADYGLGIAVGGESRGESIADVRGGEEAPVAVLPLDPDHDLYGGILFHTGRFRRLRGYRRLRATECVVEIGPDGGGDWFGRYLPGELVLGDPAARDAMIHGIQACIPHATILPIGAERITIHATRSASACLLSAHERSRAGNTLVYDLEVRGPDGELRERWDGLQLQIVDRAPAPVEWIEPLLGPFVERRIGEMLPGAAVSVAIENGTASGRRERSDQAMRAAARGAEGAGFRVQGSGFGVQGSGHPPRRVNSGQAGGRVQNGRDAGVHRRPDGKPGAVNGQSVSAAHAGKLTLAVAGVGPLGCDLEPVVARTQSVWRDLLGEERFGLAELLARQTGEPFDAVATRVWGAGESLKKAGVAADGPLVLGSTFADGWVLLRAGSLAAASLVARVRHAEQPLAITVVTSAAP